MKRNLIALAIALAFAIFISGCTGNQYVPCCIKEKIYDSVTGQLVLNPECEFPDTRWYGSCSGTTLELYEKGRVAVCEPSEIICMGATQTSKCAQIPGCTWKNDLCVPKKCSDIDDEQECTESSCTWGEGGRTSCGPSSQAVKKLLPVCVDDVPEGCINDKCTAMICGFAGYSPTPPPASQDWDVNNPEKAMPQGQSSLPSINLQGTTCSFESMNRKLYNKVAKSKGSLWVNSFRFGVGKSFSDFEQAKYFFPASDRLCNINPVGTKDRFVTYLNAPSTWCSPVIGVYACSKNSLNFIDRDVCLLYCEGDENDCQTVTGETWYQCLENKFAYKEQEDCKAKCNVVSDPNKCTLSKADYKFLGEDGRYKMKYVADFMVDTLQYSDDDSFKETCLRKTGPDGAGKFLDWDTYDNNYCDDFWPPGLKDQDGPWRWWYDPPIVEPLQPPGTSGSLRDYFEMRKSAVIDFDYDYYEKALMNDYVSSPDDLDLKLPFECDTSVECISGACDNTYHSRSLCKIADQLQPGKPTVDCGSWRDGFYDDLETYLEIEKTGIPSQINPVQRTYGRLFDRDGKRGSTGLYLNKYTYYVKASPQEHKFFSQCHIPSITASVCLYEYRKYEKECDPDGSNCEWKATRDSTKGIPLRESPGGCSEIEYEVSDTEKWVAPSTNAETFKIYSVDFSSLAQGDIVGICIVGDPDHEPYFSIDELGWCAGCTYATLAVQKIDWDSPGPPSGRSYLKNFACYEWRGEFDYSVEKGEPYNANSPGANYELRDIDEDGKVDASVTDVRQRKNNGPGPYNGNIEWEYGTSFYSCADGYHDNGWWKKGQIPEPSAPYLEEKMSSYLQSNIMPILDVTSAETGIGSVSSWVTGVCTAKSSPPSAWKCTSSSKLYETKQECTMGCGLGNCIELLGPYWSCSYEASHEGIYKTEGECTSSCQPKLVTKYITNYLPVEVCQLYGGDGAAIYALGDTDMLASGIYGLASSEPGDNVFTNELSQYLGLSSTTNTYDLDGKAAIIYRSLMLKRNCENEPLAAIEIKDYNKDTLIGDINNPGTLHKFFFDSTWFGGIGYGSYSQRVARGTPDRYAEEVDLLLQEWTPMCGTMNIRNDRYLAVKDEFENRLEFSRALLGNFSRPSLIWKFHIPQYSSCCGVDALGNADCSILMSYLFNHTGEMVDAGILGLVYDSWMTDSGKGYGTGNIDGNPLYYSGLSSPLAEGMLDNPLVKSGGEGGKDNTPFCDLQKNSRKVLGMTKYTYGQKLYADEEECECVECTETDYAMRLCSKTALNNPLIDQLVCNDGFPCKMPATITAYNKYKCPATCVDSTKCTPCSQLSSYKSFCIIDEDGKITGESKLYTEISDEYWEFLAGLPAKDKCCLVSTATQNPQEYTYVSRTSTKTQSEVLQYPTRGELGIDCGRLPDTSILEYCNIQIPISQKEIVCTKVGGIVGGGNA